MCECVRESVCQGGEGGGGVKGLCADELVNVPKGGCFEKRREQGRGGG